MKVHALDTRLTGLCIPEDQEMTLCGRIVPDRSVVLPKHSRDTRVKCLQCHRVMRGKRFR